ncbi:TPA: hypothetical protein ACGUPM_002652 [Vibrio vulnificus]
MSDSPPLLRIVSGTTYHFDVSWTTSDPDNPLVKLEGCTAVFAISKPDGTRLVTGTTESGHVSIAPKAGESDLLGVTLSPDQTTGHNPADWENATYELPMDRTITVTLRTDRIITVRLPDSVEKVVSQNPRVSVVTVGQQGPVGTVAEAVLAQAAKAESDAAKALEASLENSAHLDELVSQFTNHFNYHAGAISAQ